MTDFLHCKVCGSFYGPESKWFGKICNCGSFIPPIRELPIVEENKRKMEKIRKELYEYLSRKQGALDASNRPETS